MNLDALGLKTENLVLWILFILLKVMSVAIGKCLKITQNQQGTHRKAIKLHILNGLHKTGKQLLFRRADLSVSLKMTSSLHNSFGIFKNNSVCI